MITLENVTVGYRGNPILRNISLHVQQGENIGILGPNGSGKTTLLLTLSGILAPLSGVLFLDGKRSTELRAKERAKLLASVPQCFGEQPDILAEDVVRMGRYPHISFLKGYCPQDYDVVRKAMQSTSTSHLANRSAKELSGGEFQRVLIARALAQEAQVLLLDEATSGLDIARKVEIYNMLEKQHRQGLTMLSAIHDINLAALYCERLLFIKQGHIVLDGAVRDIFTEGNLSDVYETRILIVHHPITGVPQACLVPDVSGNTTCPAACNIVGN